MSQKYRTNFTDPLGGIIFDQIGNRLYSALSAAPTDGIPGYQPGSVYIDTLGSGTYFNAGTLASSTWRAQVGIGSNNAFIGTNSFAGVTTFTGGVVVNTAGITITDVNITLSSGTGTTIGGASDKLAFFGASPIVKPANTVDILAGLINLGLRASGGTPAFASPGKITSSSPALGIGYATGAGNVVSQGTSKTTGVSINAMCGDITLFNDALNAAAEATFTVTNTSVGSLDNVFVSHASGGTSGAYGVVTSAIGNQTFNVTITNWSAGNLSESPVIRFTVFKGATS